MVTWWGEGEDSSDRQAARQSGCCIDGHVEAQALVVRPGPVVVQRHIIPQLWPLQFPLQCITVYMRI